VVATDPGVAFSDQHTARLNPQTPPNVKVGAAKLVSGPMRANLDRVIAGLRPRVVSCYKAALNIDPDLQDTVTLRMRIMQVGEVENTTATAPKLPPALLSCIAARFRLANFDRASEVTEVTVEVELIAPKE
jgi:hypothetical protein